jgi:hypothetical protein
MVSIAETGVRPAVAKNKGREDEDHDAHCDIDGDVDEDGKLDEDCRSREKDVDEQLWDGLA